jgi:hypothetical protein
MIWLNSLLQDVGLNPGRVRLLRHETTAYRGRTPYTLWRDDRPEFERYQSTQGRHRRAYFNSPYWAAFVVPPDGRTLFVGIYEAKLVGPVSLDWTHPLDASEVLNPDIVDYYQTRLTEHLANYVGRLSVDWGAGTRSWVQIAGQQNKVVTEVLRAFSEPMFPGFGRLIVPLSQMDALPRSWIETLRSTRGVYLLTCPRTREQYIGSASGAEGFWGRWRAYFADGHGGNEGLKSRDPSDYQASILETVGSSATVDDILDLERLWKQKLQSREMGLNRN